MASPCVWGREGHITQLLLSLLLRGMGATRLAFPQSSFLPSFKKKSIYCLFIWTVCIYWRRKRQPTPVILPGKFRGGRSLVGCSPSGCTKSNPTERLRRRVCSCRLAAKLCHQVPPSMGLPGKNAGVGCHFLSFCPAAFFAFWGCPVHSGMFSSIPGRHMLDASSNFFSQ